MTRTFARSTPEAQGVSSASLTDFLAAAEGQGLELHSLMLVRHGAVVAEGWWHPYGPDTVHLLYSLSKSFTATAIGLAVAEGRLSVDDPVLKFFPDEAPAQPHPNLQGMRVRDLLNMATGHLGDTFERVAEQHDWVRGFLALPPSRNRERYLPTIRARLSRSPPSSIRSRERGCWSTSAPACSSL